MKVRSSGMKRYMTAGVCLVVLAVVAIARADDVYRKNRRANKLYRNGDYARALELYDEALLEDPDNPKLKMNRGSALYRMQEFGKAEEALKDGLSAQQKGVKADAHYNLGNTLYRQGEQLFASGDQRARRKLEAAREHFIKSLDMRPHDIDTKWNLQLTQNLLEQLRKMEQQQKNRKSNKDDSRSKDQQKQREDDQSDRESKQQQKEEEQEQQQKQQQQQPPAGEDGKDEEMEAKPQPRLSDKGPKMSEKEAERMLEQFSDDEKELNKPHRLKMLRGKKPEKDW